MLAKLPVPEIILASSSPRRQLLLERIGLPHTIISPSGDELTPLPGKCAETALENATVKAKSVIPFAGDRAILGADTVVDLDGNPLGKPIDHDDAVSMLKLLSGREHFVHTAIYLEEAAKGLNYGVIETSLVRFRTLGSLEIEQYVLTGEPLDKAGAYGIQERGSMLVERIEGCFFNVMGLPVARLWETIRLWMKDRGTPLTDW